MSSIATETIPHQSEEALKAVFEPIRGVTLGPLVMGLFVDAVFCGILVIQLIHWISWSRSEKRFTKMIVACCFLITVSTTFFNLAFLFNDLVYHWGKYANLNSVHFISWYRVFDCLAAAGTQLFFVERAASLSGWNKTVWAIFAPLIFGSCAASFTNFFLLRMIIESGGTSRLNSDPALIVWIASTVLLDVLLSLIIIYNLVQSKTGWANTDAAIKRLIRVSLEASVPAVFLSIAFLLAFVLRGNTRIPVFFDLCIGKIYVVCLMSLLNAKINLKKDMEVMSQSDDFFGQRSQRLKQAAVMVSTEVYTESHQLTRVPNSQNTPRRPPLAKDDDLEESISIDFGSNSDKNGSSVDVNKPGTVRFQNTSRSGRTESALLGQ